MHKGFIHVACIMAILSVALGAFAAHQLHDRISDKAVGIFETAVRYQLYHTFAIFITAILYKEFSNKWVKSAAWFFIIGIILFSGSLYVLTYVTAATLPGYNWFGAITPVGGLSFILGWIFLLVGSSRKRSNNRQ